MNSQRLGRQRPRNQRGAIRRVALLAVAVAALLLLAVGWMIVRWAGQGLEPLTPELLAEAEQRWQSQGPSDYDLDLQLQGARPGPVHVEVRGGQAVAMTRDGVTPRRRDTWDAWTVPGQFETLALDLEHHGPRAKPPHTPRSALLLVEFDPVFGYPRRYHKLVRSSGLEVRWDIQRFVPIGGDRALGP